MFTPIKAKPADVVFNCFDVLILFFDGIGVIKTKMALSGKVFCQPKVEAETFCMANMEIAVWFRWKTGDNLFPPTIFKIFCYDGADKV